MVSLTDNLKHSSMYVEPLQIHKGLSSGSSGEARRSWKDSLHPGDRVESSTYLQMTPPVTPNGSQEAMEEHMEDAQLVFHPFLRAFYPFHPPYTVSDSTVTLPLNEGDVVLVHSIHTNGWADGTLLLSGARGWLPTNYCEAYEPESMRSLLKGLLSFWDLLKCGLSADNEVFESQEFIRGIIAGVRYLLVSIFRFRLLPYCSPKMLIVYRRDQIASRGSLHWLSPMTCFGVTGKHFSRTCHHL
jgi:hypothetical protein